MPDYIPGADDRFSRWLDQFLTAATDNATPLGISPADVTLLGTRITDYKTRLTTCASADATAKQATADKNNSRRIIEQFVRMLAKRFTTQTGYTPALGELLGIVAPAPAPGGEGESGAPAETRPDLRGTALLDGAVEIKFTKGGSDGVNIYSQRDGDEDFVFLARDTHSPYVDNRPLLVAGKPEQRKYMGRYLRNDEEYGQSSDIVVVTAAP